MNKFLKINNKIFYALLIVSILSAVAVFIFKIAEKSISLAYAIGYSFVFFLLPLLAISLTIFMITNFKRFGFINGLKESSIKIFTLMISSLLIWFLGDYAYETSNRINVRFINKTELGISNIKLIGRNALTKIDTLAPEENKTIIFKGKHINYKTENDYENEIRLLYYFDNKWRENKILSGFSRWRVIDKDWEIKIHSADSIELKQI